MSIRHRLLAVSLISTLAMLSIIFTVEADQVQNVTLDSLDQLKLINVKAETVTFKGRKALRVLETAGDSTGEALVVLPKTDFQDGTIEVDLAGEPGPNAPEGSRGFVGLAFRVAADHSRFECFYLTTDEWTRRGSAAS